MTLISRTTLFVIISTFISTQFCDSIAECIESENLSFTYLKGNSSKRCVGVHGYNLDEGGVVDIWDCVRGAANEIWKYNYTGAFTPNREPIFQLIATSSGMCLTAGGTNGANYSPVIQTSCVSGAPNQSWFARLNESTPAHFQLVGSLSNRCLTSLGTFNGARLVIYDCLEGMGGQLWFPRA